MSGLRLPDRAVHVFFLTRLAKEKAPNGTACLGDLKTFQVVTDFVKPATAKSKTNFIDCLLQGRLDKCTLSWCPGGAMADVVGTPCAVGPTTYFVSHAWSYTFTVLVSLIERHYAGLPETNKGKDFVPVYYWVDILAVTQHFSGNFTEHPDSDFPGVIRASQAVLFTMYPWRAPIAPTRVWCLFEALTAVESPGVELEVLIDMAGSKDTGVQTVVAVVAGIDVRSAQASVASDKQFIMGRIRDGIGVEAFNGVLRKRLKEVLLERALKRSGATRDNESIVQLVKGGGARDPDGTLDVLRWLPHGTPDNITALLDGLAGARIPRRLILSGAVPGQDRDRQISDNQHRHRYGAPMWTYMPLPGKALAAVGRLLARQGGDVGAGAAATDGSRRIRPTAATAAVRSAVGVSRRSLTNQSGPADNVAAVTTTGPLQLQELWMSPAPSFDPRMVSYRPPWATRSFYAPEEEAMQGAVAPDWNRKEKQLEKQAGGLGYGEWNIAFNKANRDWNERELRKAQAAAEAREQAERPARVKAEAAYRSELWTGLGRNASLTVLGLHRGALAAKDVAALAQALRQHRCLQVLQIVDIEPEEGYPGGTGALARGLLAAGLGSRSLQRLLLTPAVQALVPDLDIPAAAAWDMGGGAALQELVLAPVALAPTAAKQLAELLASSLPALRAGCVDALKAPLRAAVPAQEPGASGEAGSPGYCYERAECVVEYPRFVSREKVSDLGPVLELRNTSSSASSSGGLTTAQLLSPTASSAIPSSSIGGSGSGATASPAPASPASPAFVAALTHFLLVNTEPPPSAPDSKTTKGPAAGSRTAAPSATVHSVAGGAASSATVSSVAGGAASAASFSARGACYLQYRDGKQERSAIVLPAAEDMAGRWDAEEHRRLQQQSLQAASPEYVSRVRRLLPHHRLGKVPDGTLSAAVASGLKESRGESRGGSGGGGYGSGGGDLKVGEEGKDSGLGSRGGASFGIGRPGSGSLGSGRLSVSRGGGGGGGGGGAYGGLGRGGAAVMSSDSDSDSDDGIGGDKRGGGGCGGGSGGAGGGGGDVSESLRLVIPKWGL